jgi:hypothetical protein
MPLGLIRKVYEKVEPKVAPVLEGVLRHPLYLRAASKSFEIVYKTIRLRKSVVKRIFDLTNLPTRDEQDEMRYLIKKVQYETQDVREELAELRDRLGRSEHAGEASHDVQ